VCVCAGALNAATLGGMISLSRGGAETPGGLGSVQPAAAMSPPPAATLHRDQFIIPHRPLHSSAASAAAAALCTTFTLHPLSQKHRPLRSFITYFLNSNRFSKCFTDRFSGKFSIFFFVLGASKHCQPAILSALSTKETRTRYVGT